MAVLSPPKQQESYQMASPEPVSEKLFPVLFKGSDSYSSSAKRLVQYDRVAYLNEGNELLALYKEVFHKDINFTIGSNELEDKLLNSIGLINELDSKISLFIEKYNEFENSNLFHDKKYEIFNLIPVFIEIKTSISIQNNLYKSLYYFSIAPYLELVFDRYLNARRAFKHLLEFVEKTIDFQPEYFTDIVIENLLEITANYIPQGFLEHNPDVASFRKELKQFDVDDEQIEIIESLVENLVRDGLRVGGILDLVREKIRMYPNFETYKYMETQGILFDKNIHWLTNKYPNQYVCFEDGKVLAFEKNRSKLAEKMRNIRGNSLFFIEKVPAVN